MVQRTDDVSMSKRVVTSAAELVNDVGVEIDGVHYFKIAASIREFSDESEIPKKPSEIEPHYGLRLRHEGNELGVRLSTTLDSGTVEIEVDVSVDYEIQDDVEIPEGVQLEFANEVGIMTLVPYVRQAVADISQRVTGEVILMPIIPRGQLRFSAGDRA